MTGVYLTPDWVTTTGLLIGVWTLLALAVGIASGKAIEHVDRTAADATWLDEAPTEHAATQEMYLPSEWFKPGTFEDWA